MSRDVRSEQAGGEITTQYACYIGKGASLCKMLITRRSS